MADTMTPWDRHAAGTGMMRFSYSSVAHLEKESLGGFLVTCSFRREKSATAEVMDYLNKYIGACSMQDEKLDPNESIENPARNIFSLIKLSRNGLVFLSTCSKIDVVSITRQILEGLSTGAEKPPLWCHRLLPLQAVCLAEKEAVFSAVLWLAKQDANLVSRTKLKYAVIYTRRDGHDIDITLERSDCFEAVGKAILEVKECASVDLSNPEIVILVEVLPIVGLNDSPLCGVALLPRDIVIIKPKLSVKPLSKNC